MRRRRVRRVDVLVEVTRSGLVESRHRGVAVRVDPDGEVVWALGDPGTVIYPRSANKPLQTLAMVREGLPLRGPLLALAASSHSAEPFHLDGVRSILAEAGLEESALRTPASYPLDPVEHAAVLRAGEGRAPIRMDCSGKHAAMLLTCVRGGWPIEDYLAPSHPVQQAIERTFAEMTDGPPAVVGVDGCGAPLLATSVIGLARAFARLAAAAPDTPEDAVLSAMRTAPEMVSGTRRSDMRLTRAVPGLVAKSGAESVAAVVPPDGGAAVVKIEDGGDRALFVAMHRVLELAGLTADLLTERPPVLGGGRPVGELRPVF